MFMMGSKYTDEIFYQNLAEILEWNLHEESVILTAEKSDVQKAKNPKWSYRPNTYVLGEQILLFFVLNIPDLFVSQYSRKSHISLFRKERVGSHHSLLISYQGYPGENLEHFKPHM